MPYNFTDPRDRDRANYKLWVKYKPALAHSVAKIKVYYSYDRKQHPQHGLHKLMKLLDKRKALVQIAILYDNRLNKEIQRFKYN
jgi:hypothetical protein